MKIKGWANIYREGNYSFEYSMFIYPLEETANLHAEKYPFLNQRIADRAFLVNFEIPEGGKDGINFDCQTARNPKEAEGTEESIQ